MDTKRYGWEAQARRTILSEEVELTSLPGIRVRARKYTIAAADEIRAAQARKRAAIPPAIRSLMTRAVAEGRSFEELLAALPPGEAEGLMAAMPDDASSVAELMSLSILYGLGEHNFDDQELRSSTVSRELVDKLMEYPDAAQEVFALVQEWNSPLLKATPATSGTSPNGSMSAPLSLQEKSSPTEGTPRG